MRVMREGEGRGRKPVPKFNPYRDEAVLVGSDCGIVCVSFRVDLNDLIYNIFDIYIWKYRTEIYLWNPETKHVNFIAAPDVYDSTCTEVIGFGFDCKTLDFKVVRVVYNGRYYRDRADVYSANMNSWHEIEAMPADTCLHYSFDVCFHGFLLCTGYRGMIPFDLHEEVFYCALELPDIDDCEAIETTVTDFNDSIAVFTTQLLSLLLKARDLLISLSCGH
ncbi:hypothetical protein POM88_006175 [Heracleum sosnowskyi]|uniref:F-box associated beta-propeller type 1 domain-containing protein n=1 Tax=Heracleum sosnowskyi TaxID=360622 RepID=A0AAD8J5I4_9APIA|nr:hypothetical protein POM88_006175 [Heracleum sosnowskyi]